MFLHLCVILFTGGGLHSGGREVCIKGVGGGLHPGGREVCIQGGLGRPSLHRILRDTVNERVVHIPLECILVTGCNWANVMFLQASVILSTGGVSGRETIPGQREPPKQGEPPLARRPPWQADPPPAGRTPPGKETPLAGRPPPQSRHPSGPDPPEQTPAYGL